MLPVKVKICGLTLPEDVEALDGLVDYLGFIVSKRRVSPRILEPQRARDLAELALRSRRVLVAHGYGVDEVLDLTARLEVFPVVQYHNYADPRDLERLRDGLDGLGVALAPVVQWNGLRLNPEPCEAAAAVPRHEYLLVDAEKGLGAVYEAGLRVPLWAYREAVKCTSRSAAAGGVNPGNACMVASLGVHVIDVSSGVESEPGRKDVKLVNSLIEVVRRCPQGIPGVLGDARAPAEPPPGDPRGPRGPAWSSRVHG